MKTSTLFFLLDMEARPSRKGEENESDIYAAMHAPAGSDGFLFMARKNILAQKMAEKHMYVPSYDDRDREWGL